MAHLTTVSCIGFVMGKSLMYSDYDVQALATDATVLRFAFKSQLGYKAYAKVPDANTSAPSRGPFTTIKTLFVAFRITARLSVVADAICLLTKRMAAARKCPCGYHQPPAPHVNIISFWSTWRVQHSDCYARTVTRTYSVKGHQAGPHQGTKSDKWLIHSPFFCLDDTYTSVHSFASTFAISSH